MLAGLFAGWNGTFAAVSTEGETAVTFAPEAGARLPRCTTFPRRVVELTDLTPPDCGARLAWGLATLILSPDCEPVSTNDKSSALLARFIVVLLVAGKVATGCEETKFWVAMKRFVFKSALLV